MEALIKKYDRQGPRYTSYPPVPFWREKPSVHEWVHEINEQLKKDGVLDLYLHIPYCEKLCYYCGCNRTITKDKSQSGHYADLLVKEWRKYLSYIKVSDFKIGSIHLGGGTPTFLLPDDLDRLFKEFESHLHPDFTGAIEIDPRTCTSEHLKVLKKHNVTRISLGIQDFDENVQLKINRHQSFEMVSQLTKKLREMNFSSLNFDLIYGLPGQTMETVKATLEKVSELAPDTIAFYSYAHLPSKIPNQKLIKDSDLPQGEEKLFLYLDGKKQLSQMGFVHIGMDHFAKEDSFLNQRELMRNFMGYTDKKSTLLIGLGASSIGQSPNMFVQNAKGPSEYEDQLELDLPIAHGHKLTSGEKLMSQYLQDLFCRGEVQFDADFKISEEVDKDLSELEKDKLIIRSNQKIKVTEQGQNFLRNIAMVIDPLMDKTQTNQFSKTI